LKFSEFALQLREKQKAKRYYGMSEKQFVGVVGRAERSKEITGTALLKLLESRLDNVIYTLGFANSRREARQLVSHKHIQVNGKTVNVPSYSVRKGDVITVDEKSREMNKVLSAIQARHVETCLHGLRLIMDNLKEQSKMFQPVTKSLWLSKRT
jgi:small subunit ribosomal protein S4